MIRPWTMAELETPLNGQLLGAGGVVNSVTTDSRSCNEGALFVALSGDNFDGHDFLPQVLQSQAVGAVVDRKIDCGLPLLQVADTEKALGKLGAYNRQGFSGPLVAITGSSGKTTVKNLVNGVLSQRGKTLATEGNLNNEIGVPLTLLRLEGSHEFAVVEMGAGRPGDIAWLCEIGQPTISLLLNALPAHLEGFKDVDAVARTKGEIFDGLDQTDVAIINTDQPWASQWMDRAAPASVISFGVHHQAQISASDIQLKGVEGVHFVATTPAGEMPVALSLPGAHNVSNALAAIAVGLACELTLDEIRAGLESVKPVAGRLSVNTSGSGAQFIDDCYNANPGSVRAAIAMLAACDGRRTLVLGAMKELGENSDDMHREIGLYAKSQGLEQFIGVGAELAVAVDAFGDGGVWYPDRESLIEVMSGQFTQGDLVLIKGSRSTGMERVLQALCDSTTEPGA